MNESHPRPKRLPGRQGGGDTGVRVRGSAPREIDNEAKADYALIRDWIYFVFPCVLKYLLMVRILRPLKVS